MESSQRPCTGPGTESVSQTRAAAQNRLLAVPFQQDIAFMHIHVANDHYRHASQRQSPAAAPRQLTAESRRQPQGHAHSFPVDGTYTALK